MDCPRLVLDPTGRERDAETAELCARGPATPVDILGVEAWAVADPGLLELLLKDPRVSKDGHRHWPGFPKVVPTWPLAVWVTARDTEGEGEAAALTEQELRDTLLLVVSAGYETTVNLIDNGIALLLTHPDQLAEVRAAGRGGATSSRRRCATTPRWRTCPCATPSRTSGCRTR